MDSLTIHGNSPCSARVPPTTRGPGSSWAEVGAALAEWAGTMTRAAVIALKTADRRILVRSMGGASSKTAAVAQFVHPPAQPVMALECEGTDAPGSRPNRNGRRCRGRELRPELEQQPGGAQVVRRRAAGPQFSLTTARKWWPDGDTAQEC